MPVAILDGMLVASWAWLPLGRGKHGGHGFGTPNTEGEGILEFAIANGLHIGNTWFKKRHTPDHIQLWWHLSVDRLHTLLQEFLGLYSLSGKTSYRQISWSLEAARLDVSMVVSLWNLTGNSTAAEVPANFQSDWKSLNSNLAASRLHEILR